MSETVTRAANASYMRQEVEETPAAIARLLSEGKADFAAAGKALRDANPTAIVTIAAILSATSHVAYAALGIAAAALSIFTHRTNLAKLRRRTDEPRRS